MQVDNSHSPFIPPLSVGFALYGGIYRDVWLVATDPLHFTMSDYGSSGIAVKTPSVSRERGRGDACAGTLMNDGTAPRRCEVVNTILDAAGKTVMARRSSHARVAARASRFAHAARRSRRRISGRPRIRTSTRVRTEIVRRRAVDRPRHEPARLPLVSRSTRQGFSLNGEKLQLRGTNRHQDYAGLGSALSNDLHRTRHGDHQGDGRELRASRALSAGSRRARGGRSPRPVDLGGDPRTSTTSRPDPRSSQNAETMLREMIRQHRNHPSVIIWGTMNEVFLWAPGGVSHRRAERHDVHAPGARRSRAHMDSLARARGSRRATRRWRFTGARTTTRAASRRHSQVLGLNLYDGWYSGDVRRVRRRARPASRAHAEPADLRERVRRGRRLSRELARAGAVRLQQHVDAPLPRVVSARRSTRGPGSPARRSGTSSTSRSRRPADRFPT